MNEKKRKRKRGARIPIYYFVCFRDFDIAVGQGLK